MKTKTQEDFKPADRSVANTAPVEPKPVEAKREGPKDEINKQIADHEKWMGDHTDDARGVQERLQEVAVLQQKLVELDAPKTEQRVRQTQTV